MMSVMLCVLRPGHGLRLCNSGFPQATGSSFRGWRTVLFCVDLDSKRFSQTPGRLPVSGDNLRDA